LLQEFAGTREDLIPILQSVQAADGYLRPDATRLLSRRLQVPESEIYGVATFFAQFRFAPPGRHQVRVCLGTACHVRGGAQILAATQERLGIRPGETTADGEFDLDRVACLGCCALAPVLAVNDKVHAQVSVLKVRGILDDCQPR
jgi:NADH-quinone oxidoreductase subunit E